MVNMEKVQIKIETYWNVNDKRKIEAYNNEIRLKQKHIGM